MIRQFNFQTLEVKKTIATQWRKIERNTFFKIGLLPALIALFLELLLFNRPTAWFVGGIHQVKLPESLFFPTSVTQPVSFQTSSDTPVGRPLTNLEQNLIRQLLPEIPKQDRFPVFEQVPLFILHDTAGLLSKETIYQQQKKNQGPLGDGIAAYIARDGEAIVTRSNFWDIRRPTALAYEKALDILSETRRNQILRQVYQLTSERSRNIAFKQVTTELKVKSDYLIKGANIWLNTASENQFESVRRRYPNGLDGAKSTGIWAMTQVCHDVLEGVMMANSEDKQTQLIRSCQIVYPALKNSRQRISAAVNVELVQHRASHCFLTDAQVKAYNERVDESAKIDGDRVISLQQEGYNAYPDLQYEGVALVYLYAALQAGVFPEITTHFLLDKDIGSHCDPRGLDLNYLYGKISQKLGHPWGTRYGIQPQYGTNLESGDNVWWASEVLGIEPLF